MKALRRFLAETADLWMWFGIFVCFLILVMTTDHRPVRDDTDPPGARSGLTLYTDHETGCQYLSEGSGLTPRLGPDGKQICTP